MAFVKIDKEILNSYCFANPNHLKIWIWLLVKANYKKTFAPLKIGKGYITVKVERGQLLFGRFKAEEELSLDGSLIYRVLKIFEEQEQIKVESNNQYSLITICKYDSYQNNNQESEQPTNNQRTTDEQPTENERKTDEQQVNTSKEVLEYIEDIEIDKNKDIELFQKFWDLYEKKKGKKNSQTQWNKLTQIEKELAVSSIPNYKLSQPNEKYRKDPERYLSQKIFNDEFVLPKKIEPTKKDSDFEAYQKRLQELNIPS